MRNYVNDHFEAVKDEVRRQVSDRGDEIVRVVGEHADAGARRSAELSSSIAALESEIGELRRELLELRTTNDQLLAVVAAMTERPDPPVA